MIWFVGIMGLIVVALIICAALGDFTELDRAEPGRFDE